MPCCWSCDLTIDRDDHYCRHCGQGQGAFVAWYYRPLWIVLLGLTVLGPFALPLVWRTPQLGRTAKVIATVVVVGVSAYLGWEFIVTLREVGRLLVGGDLTSA